MAHEIMPGPNPNIMIMRLSNSLTFEDMTADEELGLNEGRPLYVLLDASNIDIALPDNFLSGARQSYFINDNLQHMALYVKSAWLKAIGEMVAKLTRRREKLSVYNSYEAAMAHLVKLEKESRTVR
jgi:hypothetical protein